MRYKPRQVAEYGLSYTEAEIIKQVTFWEDYDEGKLIDAWDNPYY